MIADPRDVIIAPVISEKSYGLLEERQYTFLVRPDANKTQIKIAVQQIFDVQVATWPTALEGLLSSIWGKDTKRAVVTVTPESRTIDVFGAPGAGT